LLGLAIGRVAGLGGLALAGLGEPAVRAGLLGRGADLLGIRGGGLVLLVDRTRRAVLGAVQPEGRVLGGRASGY
jgi:hypothetical protein